VSRPSPPPRLHVLFARRAPRALLLLRGPTDWYHLVGWNTASDTFEPGAWFKGRIYEDKCDLSPNGELLVYVALKERLWATGYQGCWTAVSRAPWLYARALWPEGSTWGSGSCFADDRTLILNGPAETHPDHPLVGLKVKEGNCRREIPEPDIPQAEWAGYDQSGAPVFYRDGILYRRLPREDRPLANSKGRAPDPTEAPEWAKRPLPPLPRIPSGRRALRHQRKNP